MFLILACAHTAAPSPGIPAAPPQGPAAPAASTAPTPFTAEQLAAAFPAGTVVRLKMEVAGQPTVIQRWEFLAPTAEGVTIASQVYDEQGTLLADEGKGTDTWVNLRDHAAFPAASTTIEAERIETPLGALATRRYTVAQADPPALKRYWFADELPGPPVLFTQENDGAEMFRMTMIERSRP